jgi:hypothetical protein
MRDRSQSADNDEIDLRIREQPDDRAEMRLNDRHVS